MILVRFLDFKFLHKRAAIKSTALGRIFINRDRLAIAVDVGLATQTRCKGGKGRGCGLGGHRRHP